jgi:hypothetical protein
MFGTPTDPQEALYVSRSLRLSVELFDKLARAAAQRFMTIEGILAFVSEFVVVPD